MNKLSRIIPLLTSALLLMQGVVTAQISLSPPVLSWEAGETEAKVVRVTSSGSPTLSDTEKEIVYDRNGNVRAVLRLDAVNAAQAVLEVNGYLPYGTRTEGAVSLQDNRYRYAGKEEQKALSLIDFGARLYDPFTARWTTQDPLA